MGRLVVFENLSVDGVMQAPGRPDEDRRGGFDRGGWAVPFADAEMGRVAAESMSNSGALLLGRRTYEDFYKVWPSRTDNPYTDVLNKSQKYVASTTLRDPLPWENSTLLDANVPEAVATLKGQWKKDMVILGSSELVRSLMKHNLVDEYVLHVFPLILGSGRRLFADDGTFAALRLVDVKHTTKGVVIATYQPTEQNQR